MPRLILAVFLTAGFVFGFIPSTTAQGAEAATENAQSAKDAAETASPETDPAKETASPEEARLVIEDFHAGLLDILKRSEQLGHEGRAEELYPIVKQAINVRALGGMAVGRRTWTTWSEEQQEQFIESFTQFMSATYAARFKKFNNQEFVITGFREGRGGSVFIKTEVRNAAQDEPVEILYLLINQNDSWGIADIYLDNAVSEVALRRSEFSAILRKDGYQGLLAALEEKTADRATR